MIHTKGAHSTRQQGKHKHKKQKRKYGQRGKEVHNTAAVLLGGAKVLRLTYCRRVAVATRLSLPSRGAAATNVRAAQLFRKILLSP